MRRLLLAGCGLALLTGCETPRPGTCGAREVTLRNASALAAEQAYGGTGAPDGWGQDLLGSGDLPPGARRVLRLPGGARAVRVVWSNGRAAELRDVDLCAVATLTLTDTALLPR